MSIFEKISQAVSQTKFIIILIILTTIFTVILQTTAHLYGLNVLDDIVNPELARQTILAMSPQQITAHTFITGLVDVFNPFFFSLLFVSLIYRLYPKFGKYLVIPAFIIIPTDLLEGVIQLLALHNITDLLDLKMYVTSLKIVLMLVSLIITSLGVAKWFITKLIGK